MQEFLRVQINTPPSVTLVVPLPVHRMHHQKEQQQRQEKPNKQADIYMIYYKVIDLPKLFFICI